LHLLVQWRALRSVCSVVLHATVNCIKIFTVAQQCSYGKIMSQVTIHRTWVLWQNVRCWNETEECLMMDRLVKTCSLAKQNVMAGKSSGGLSVFVKCW